jgi:VWFA-related protein
MNIRNKLILPSLLCMALLPAQQTQPAAAEKQAPPGQATPTFRTGVEEVVLDVIVRDKKGKPVKDLSASDFKIVDDGVDQKILGARVVEGAEAIEKGSKVPLDAMHQIRLVSLVFEQLGDTDRLNAKRAALDLVKGDQAQNVFYSVVVITTKLNVVQPFTTDKELLKKAIEKATSGKYLQFPGESDRIKAELKEIAGKSVAAPQSAAAATPGPGAAGTAAGAAAGAGYIEKRTSQIMLDMLEFDSSYSRDEGSRISIFSLLSLVRGQYSMPGRKTIIYFTWGMYVPTNLDEPFRNIMSAANRGNVTFYSVDTRGVVTSSQTQGARDALNSATSDIQKDTTATDGAVSKSQITASDRAESAGRSNTQMPIRDLAESTGGFLIADANDFRPSLKKVNEEVSSYYEITYNPGIENYDGRFRKTHVEVTRKDLVVQARNGYFALPVNVRGPAVLPYEFALLKALDSTPAPAGLEYRSGVLRLKPAADGTKAIVMVEVPMSGVTFTENVTAKTFKMRLSTVALVKDEKGEVVQKLSNDLPRSGPLAMMSKAGFFVYKDQVQVPPGKYTLETAVMDHEANKIGVKKSEFVVDAPKSGVGLSSLCLVRNYQPGVKDLDPNDPMQFQGGRITPTMSGQVYAAPGAQLSTFFIVYPDPSIKSAPTAKIEFLVEGNSVANLDLPLPAPDAQGRIPYVMSAPAENLPPATYEIHITVKQGNSTDEERMKVAVLPKP